MTNQLTEVTIVGEGMVGGTLALGLAQHGFSVTMIEHAEPAPFVADSQPNVRTSAISAVSVSLPKGLGVWDTVQAMHCHPYHRLETWKWRTTYVMFDAAELKLPLLDYMMENTVLQQVLWQTLEAHPKVMLCASGSLAALHRGSDLQELELKGDKVVCAKLVIGIDGANSQMRQTAEIDAYAWQYAQSHILISVQCENDPGDSIWQQFIPDGSRAFPPLFDNQASLMWYDSPVRTRQLQNMNMAQPQAEITRHFPSRLGYVTPFAAGAFPLARRHALRHVQPGLALVGDITHTIHPLTGQGVNSGYRDVDALIDVLVGTRSYGEAWASHPVFERYQMRCMMDNFIMRGGMDPFYVGFSNNLSPLRFVHNLELMAAERTGVLKHQALRYALGLQPYNIAGCAPTVGQIRRGSVASDIEG